MSVRLKLVGQVVAVATVAALLALLVWKLARGEGAQTASGVAPGFTLPRLDREGESLSLASLRGKAVVLNFWASWCVPCREEAAVLEATWDKYRSRGLVVLGVDVQDFGSDARRFARRYGMTYPIVRDGPGTLLGKYGATGVPETYFIDRRGRLVGERIQGRVDANEEISSQYEDGVKRALAP